MTRPSEEIPGTEKIPPLRFSTRLLVSIAIASYLLLLTGIYAGNWHRSGAIDSFLSSAHPFSIGACLNVELLPIELGRAPAADKPARLIVGNRDGKSKSLIFLDSTTQTRDRYSQRQLLNTLAVLIEAMDDESTCVLLSSIVQHIETLHSPNFDSIWIEQKSQASSPYETIFFADVIRIEGESPRVVPQIEHQRTAPAMGLSAMPETSDAKPRDGGVPSE